MSDRTIVTTTSFGTVTRTASETKIAATGAVLRDWATRGHHRWPCSQLADMDDLTVTFDASGDLVAIEGDERADLACDELDAWSSECLIRAGYPNHPVVLRVKP